MQDVDEVEDIREMEDYDMMDEERSLSRSISQMTTRGEATQPDEDIENVTDNYVKFHWTELDVVIVVGPVGSLLQLLKGLLKGSFFSKGSLGGIMNP